MIYSRLIGSLCFTILGTCHCAAPQSGCDNGFGKNYIWAGSYESARKIAMAHKKPALIIIHKSWCSACKRLKPKFANSEEIIDLSKHFVMVNLMDTDEPDDKAFTPDGNYIPRIFFLSPAGKIDHAVYNSDGSAQYRYYYSKPEQIAKSMRHVLKKYNVELNEKPQH